MAVRAPGPREILARSDAPVTAAALGIRDDTPVLVVAGTTGDIEPGLSARILPALKEAVSLAVEHNIVVVTGGTDAGVFHLLGLALSSGSARPPLVVGVVPDSRVPSWGDTPGPGQAAADPQLDVLVRVPGAAWGDEIPWLSALVSDIAGDAPSALLLVGGGEVSRADVAEHLAHGRPVVALNGTGRLADALDLDRAVAAGSGGDGAAPTDLPALLATGDVRKVPVDDVRAVRRQLGRALAPRKRRVPIRERIAALSVMPRVRLRLAAPPPPLSLTQARQFPLLQARVAEAERMVYPEYARWDITARREQNRHRWFSVLAIGGALLTTSFGAVQAWLQDETWPGVAVATLGAATSVLTSMARRQGTLYNYMSARTRAERLKALYFEHIGQPPPTSDRAAADDEMFQLGRRVTQISSGALSR
jgi:SLOG in TRPM, prokaryote